MASNRTWFTTKPEYYGKIPARTEILVLPADPFVWCPLCGKNVHGETLGAHCEKEGDKNHLALDVMRT